MRSRCDYVGSARRDSPSITSEGSHVDVQAGGESGGWYDRMEITLNAPRVRTCARAMLCTAIHPAMERYLTPLHGAFLCNDRPAHFYVLDHDHIQKVYDIHT
jgi:hypothetical protein